MDPKVEKYLNKITSWQAETEQMRKILLECKLTEELKWGKPCYAYEDKNIAIIQGFKEYFALLFFKGALLKDPEGVLVKTGPNTQVGRQLRFTDAKEIVKLKTTIKAYIKEAVEIEKAGLKVEVTKEAKPMPEELQIRLKKDANFKTAFNALTPGRQRAYIYHFSEPKQAKTREARIEKNVPRILDGKGLLD